MAASGVVSDQQCWWWWRGRGSSVTQLAPVLFLGWARWLSSQNLLEITLTTSSSSMTNIFFNFHKFYRKIDFALLDIQFLSSPWNEGESFLIPKVHQNKKDEKGKFVIFTQQWFHSLQWSMDIIPEYTTVKNTSQCIYKYQAVKLHVDLMQTWNSLLALLLRRHFICCLYNSYRICNCISALM